jgi:hypothetical protein
MSDEIRLNVFYDIKKGDDTFHYLETCAYPDAISVIKRIIEKGAFCINYDVYKRHEGDKMYVYAGNVKVK